MGSNRGCVYRLFLFIAVVLAHDAAAEAISAEYFTDSRHFPMSGNSHEAVVTLYDLAAPVLLEQAFSAGLPANPVQAEAKALAWLKANQAKLSGQLQAAYASHAKALDYGLKKYPAWVFDGRATVYGVTDLQEGLGLYRKWLTQTGTATPTQPGRGNPP